MIHLYLLLVSVGALFLTSCSSKSFDDEEIPVLRMRGPIWERACQIAKLRWITLNPVPTQGGYYAQGDTVWGIPYSSVKETETFVGQNVSMYTFMTAVSNPKSVLYTEDVAKPPYHGTNCSTYYGTVCSMAVNYVLGIPYPYTTSSYKSLDCFEKVQPQEVEYAECGDILLQDKKHVVIIVDIERVDGVVDRIAIMESSGGIGTRIDYYSRESLLERWHESEWELLRYKEVDRIGDITTMSFNNYPYDNPFNSPLCCSRGDRASFRKGEEVVLNNLDGCRHDFLLKKGVDIIAQYSSSREDITFTDLDEGIYSLELENASWTHPSFEILDTNVSLVQQKKSLTVSFSSSNSNPLCIVVSNLNGARILIEPLTPDDLSNGFKTIEKPAYNGQLFLKVLFEGFYGSVCNEPIPIL